MKKIKLTFEYKAEFAREIDVPDDFDIRDPESDGYQDAVEKINELETSIDSNSEYNTFCLENINIREE